MCSLLPFKVQDEVHPAPHLPDVDLVAWCLHAELSGVEQDCANCADVIPALRMGIPAAMRMREVANGEVQG